MRVKNMIDTTTHTCKCVSWLAHWIEYSGESLPKKCQVVGCNEKPEVGAHVQKVDSDDGKWYIIPFCKNHNNKRGETFDIENAKNLSLANKKQTCCKE